MAAPVRRFALGIPLALATVLALPRASGGEPVAAQLVFPPGWSAPVRVVTSGVVVSKVVSTEVGDRYAGTWTPVAKGHVAVVVFASNTAETHARVEPPAAPAFVGLSFTAGGSSSASRARTAPAVAEK